MQQLDKGLSSFLDGTLELWKSTFQNFKYSRVDVEIPSIEYKFMVATQRALKALAPMQEILKELERTDKRAHQATKRIQAEYHTQKTESQDERERYKEQLATLLRKRHHDDEKRNAVPCIGGRYRVVEYSDEARAKEGIKGCVIIQCNCSVWCTSRQWQGAWDGDNDEADQYPNVYQGGRPKTIRQRAAEFSQPETTTTTTVSNSNFDEQPPSKRVKVEKE